jgi:alkanesulfonate monooxygenase SsuD/methylene tetrahydromethanopterin reductase-like flavin-dependent oxidoreductase (luciferase family)
MLLNFGIHLPTHSRYDYSDIEKISIIADKLGYNSLWVGDHFFLPEEIYIKTGGDPKKPNKLDAWTVLTAIAVKTKRIRLGTRVSPIPFYMPAKLAKIITTVDIISNGRINFGVGAGWFKNEAISYGFDWENHKERITKMLEGLEIILKLWKEDKATYNGKYYKIYNAPFWPKPIQKPHPPIWFGGTSKDILEATVKYGDGFLFLTDTPLEKFKEITKEIIEKMKYYGRKREISLAPSLSYPNGLGEKTSEWISKIESYIKLNANTILIDFSQTNVPPDKAITILKKFSKVIFPKYKKLST